MHDLSSRLLHAFSEILLFIGSCTGCCNSEMELDPVSLLPKQVNQSCCAPIRKRSYRTQLWCRAYIYCIA